MRKLLCLTALALTGCGGGEPHPWVPPGGGFEGEKVVAAPDGWDGTRRGDVSYQLLVYSFADGADADRVGDLEGLTARLDHIDALGASAVWLSPIHPASSYHGYDVLDYGAVNPAFGDEAAMRRFIEAAHARGIKVYLDWVVNHTSSSHPWFTAAKTSADNPYRGFYAFSVDPAADIAAGREPQIASEDAAGYDASQWFATGTGAGMSGRLKFSLDWSGAIPTVTVERSAAPPDAENTTPAPDDRYLYFGEGVSRRFHNRGGGRYELTLDFDSAWGFLVRTTTASWNAGEKFGAPDNRTAIEFGKPFALDASTATDICFALSERYHSHFGTPSFADLDFGPASGAETLPAFEALAAAGDKWIAMGVDGFRLDAVKHIYHNAYSDENPVFLGKLHRRMNASWRGAGELYMVGEMYDSHTRAAPYYRGLPALFEFDFWNRLRWALQNGVGQYFTKDVAAMRAAYAAVRPDYTAATKLSNHDEVRAGTELGGSVAKMKLAAAVLMTAPGQPYVYQGEELGYLGAKDGGDEWVRTPVMWDATGGDLAVGALGGKVDASMLTAAISVESQSKDEGSLLTLYRTLARLRNTYPALAEGDMAPHAVYNDANADFPSIAAWYRRAAGERMLVVHNFGDEARILTLSGDNVEKAVAVVGEVLMESATSRVQMGALSSVVFLLKD